MYLLLASSLATIRLSTGLSYYSTLLLLDRMWLIISTWKLSYQLNKVYVNINFFIACLSSNKHKYLHVCTRMMHYTTKGIITSLKGTTLNIQCHENHNINFGHSVLQQVKYGEQPTHQFVCMTSHYIGGYNSQLTIVLHFLLYLMMPYKLIV